MQGQKQIQKLSQKMVLSRNMQQSINILSMQTIDLKNFIEKEIIENPFLEMDDSMNFENNSINQVSIHKERSGGDNNFNQEELLSKLVDKSLTLKEYIVSQINLTLLNNDDKLIAYYMTDMLDENGYLRKSEKSIAEELKIPAQKIEAVIKILKTFDPLGVFSINLEECLKMQAIEKNIYDEKFQKLLDNLDLLAKLDFKSLKKACEISEENLQNLISELKKLNPKPGRDFITTGVQMAIPEIMIGGNKEYGFYPVLNDNAIPNCFYQNYVNSKHLNSDEKEFCLKRKNTAIEIVNALSKRKKLLLNVAEKILEFQYEFFANGVNFLKPLVITDIAKKLEVNESTISRISNKFIETPHGVFEIKFFFSSKIKAEFTESHHSSTSVKNKIKNVISGEENNNILSDEAVSNILKEHYNILISRRTVAKYRESMKIPSSAIRKRLRKMSVQK
ncbi:RNA polymerase factor sigma-54 [Candidatus Bandiella numerosa]|uniref:RNA polymerase factor sigma-54 n=1 Tax=Candidatus Bandiella numerosa TaxID=2570586 RepID=UPI00249DEDCE|nr:RNA polymerase factor sigma-54 [Candidatus Bandiella numerosa]WHA05484.1 RNA polymerase factor sigma-54 [Candidatus Bandiella numerosa]